MDTASVRANVSGTAFIAVTVVLTISYRVLDHTMSVIFTALLAETFSLSSHAIGRPSNTTSTRPALIARKP